MLDQQRKYISETTSKDEQLKKALEEISALNKKLAEERTESEEKVRNCGEVGLHLPPLDLVFSQAFSIHNCQLYGLFCSPLIPVCFEMY